MQVAFTHWKKMKDNDFLGPYAIDPGTEPIYTIDHVKQMKVIGANGVDANCPVLFFVEKGIKPFPVNTGNAKTISKLAGSPYIENWTGIKVQLYVVKVKAFGEMTEGVRIRPISPDKPKPFMSPDHKKWDAAVAKLKAGETSIEGMKKFYTLSKEHEALMLKLMQEEGE